MRKNTDKNYASTFAQGMNANKDIYSLQAENPNLQKVNHKKNSVSYAVLENALNQTTKKDIPYVNSTKSYFETLKDKTKQKDLMS